MMGGRTRRPERQGLSLDSLMDILTCLVGVMLLVVIFAVLEARGANVRMRMPLVREPPGDAERTILLCQDRGLRLLDFDIAVERLLDDPTVHDGTLDYDGVPALVERANERGFSDDYFSYHLDYREWTDGGWWKSRSYRAVEVVIEPREKQHALDELERNPDVFASLADALAARNVWIAFLVDSTSLDVFRCAREICVNRGIATGWDPVSLEFPYRQTVLGGGGGGGDDEKPEGNASTVQF